MDDNIIVEAVETDTDFGYGITITLSEKNAKKLLERLLDTEDHCGCLGGDYPFSKLIYKLGKALK